MVSRIGVILANREHKSIVPEYFQYPVPRKVFFLITTFLFLILKEKLLILSRLTTDEPEKKDIIRKVEWKKNNKEN